jgi:hypothetical protein
MRGVGGGFGGNAMRVCGSRFRAGTVLLVRIRNTQSLRDRALGLAWRRESYPVVLDCTVAISWRQAAADYVAAKRADNQ